MDISHTIEAPSRSIQDSISKLKVNNEQASLFTETQHDSKQINVELRNSNQQDWIFFALLIITSCFIYIRFSYNNSFRNLTQAVYNRNIANQIIRDQPLLIRRTSFILQLIFIFTSGMLAYQLSNYFRWSINLDGFTKYLLFSLGITLIYQAKYLFLHLTGTIFKLTNITRKYIFYVKLMNNFLGLFLLPVVITIAFLHREYINLVILLSFFIIFISLIYRYVSIFSAGMKYFKFYKTYFFLYLCTFEIIPWMFFIKFFNKYFIA